MIRTSSRRLSFTWNSVDLIHGMQSASPTHLLMFDGTRLPRSSVDIPQHDHGSYRTGSSAIHRTYVQVIKAKFNDHHRGGQITVDPVWIQL